MKSFPEYFPPALRHTAQKQLLFANHEGKAGTILKCNFNFEPNNQFKIFFNQLNGIETSPITIDKGNNLHLSFNLTVYLSKWKELALARLLNNELIRNVEELVTTAIVESETDYEHFCDFMEMPGELGKLTIEVTMTSGRFREGVRKKVLVKDIPLQKKTDDTVTFSRKCLNKWELREPNKNQLLLDLRGPI